MKFNIITIFPKIISDYCDETILHRAQKNNLIKINPVNLRDFTEDKHKTVDDTPYGGGAGMVMKPEPIYKALASLCALSRNKEQGTRNKQISISNSQLLEQGTNVLMKVVDFVTGKSKKNKMTILLSPRGKQFDQRMAEKFSKLDEITFVCGRYEGIDQRVVENMVDEEISIGPYVLAGGELGALIIIEAVSRLIPGVLGNPESLDEETFGMQNAECRMVNGEIDNSKFKIQNSEIQKEYPQYTKPEDFKGWKVPSVLLSGNHAEIKKWREEKSK